MTTHTRFLRFHRRAGFGGRIEPLSEPAAAVSHRPKCTVNSNPRRGRLLNPPNRKLAFDGPLPPSLETEELIIIRMVEWQATLLMTVPELERSFDKCSREAFLPNIRHNVCILTP
jgi:hypothetical protein